MTYTNQDAAHTLAILADVQRGRDGFTAHDEHGRAYRVEIVTDVPDRAIELRIWWADDPNGSQILGCFGRLDYARGLLEWLRERRAPATTKEK